MLSDTFIQQHRCENPTHSFFGPPIVYKMCIEMDILEREQVKVKGVLAEGGIKVYES